jgi:HSP90 family molecular chaperone
MLTTLSRKIGQQSKQVSRKIGKQSKQVSRKIGQQSKRISKRLNKTIRNDSTKVRQFYKKMFKKFKGGCTFCGAVPGIDFMKGG